jgi:hypothetical protein
MGEKCNYPKRKRKRKERRKRKKKLNKWVMEVDSTAPFQNRPPPPPLCGVVLRHRGG